MTISSPQTKLYTPQKGKQTDFLASTASFTLYGGAAGGGKTYGSLLQPLRYLYVRDVNIAIFRQQLTDLNQPGSIWIESQKIYRDFNLKPNLTLKQYKLPAGGMIKFSGLKGEEYSLSRQGASFDMVIFDEVTQMREDVVWHIFSRLRSQSGNVIPHAYATCNPQKKGWVKDLLVAGGYIDKDEYAIEGESAKIKYLVRSKSSELHFFESEEKAAHFIAVHFDKSERIMPISFTFIPATIEDNQILLKNDPTYYSFLAQQSEGKRKQLLEGWWGDFDEGQLFKATWFNLFFNEIRHPDLTFITTDTASSIKTANDFSVFQIWQRKDDKLYLINQLRGKWTASEQLELLSNLIVSNKAKYVSIERAATGFHLIDEIKKKTGVLVIEQVRTKDKYARAYDIQSYVEQGYIYLNSQQAYYTDFVAEVVEFAPENETKQYVHDDQVDAFIDAVNIAFIQKLDYHSKLKALTPRFTYRRKV